MNRRSLFTGVTCSLLLAASACGGGKPKVLGADGRPAFDSTLVRHPGGEPYHCFRSVDARGDERTSCEVIKEWCVREMNAAEGRQQKVLSGCVEAEAVHCFAAYSSGSMMSGAKAYCYETQKDCDELGAIMSEAMGKDNVSACQMLDRAFEPKG